MLVTAVPDAERPLAAAAFPGARIVAAPFASTLLKESHDARVLCVAYTDRVDPALLERMPRLQAVVTRSDGFDHLPVEWLRERGVAGYHLGDYAAEPVAHQVLSQLVALLRRFPEGQARTRAGRWDRSGLVGRSLLDATVGVLGTGRIGGRVARLLTTLGARVLAHDLVHDAALERLPNFQYARDLDDLLARSDALTVHVPLDETTHHLLDAAALARLPRGSVLVNTARGGVVDQAAVEAALRSGHLAGYAADVLPGEPTPPDVARFTRFDNVLLTPHLAAYDERTIRERHARAGRIAEAVLKGEAERVREWRVA